MSSTELTIDSREIQFITNEWLKVAGLSESELYADFDQDTIDLLIQEGHKFAIDVVAPTFAESDRVGCQVVDNRVKVPECLHEPYIQGHELGWTSLTAKPEYGGQGAPHIIGLAVKDALLGANLGWVSSIALAEGVARMIDAFGTEEQKQKYNPKLISGEYIGTMCLSEPHAGSDVGANSSIAEPVGDGRYKVKGTKSWITGGDTDLGHNKNIIHAVLARVKGAPEGTKGLSLFIIPTFTINDDGSIGEHNDVTLASLEHKMGFHCSPTCVMNFGENDNCYGYLLGEENHGIQYMFQLMNEARLGTGALAMGAAAAAYENTRAYAKERVQGVHINNMKNPDAERVAIIEHPDVRLMLTGMKARVEAMRALMYGVTEWEDRILISQNEDERQDLHDLVDFMVPMCKGWVTEVALDVVRSGIQVLGGVGYTKDFPLEQFYRDLRVAAIYEGTTGIQALDLVGRKMTMRNGALFMKVLGRFNQLVEEHQDHPQLGDTVKLWGAAGEKTADAAMELQSMLSDRGMAGAALYATPFMMFISAVTAGYFYIQQGVVAAEKLDSLKQENNVDDSKYAEFLQSNSDALFYDNKLKTVRFYVNVVLPTFESLVVPIKRKNYDALDVAL